MIATETKTETHGSTRWIWGKVANLKSMVSAHYTTLVRHVTIMRTSCFDTNFVSQIKLTKLPLINCFVRSHGWGHTRHIYFNAHCFTLQVVISLRRTKMPWQWKAKYSWSPVTVFYRISVKQRVWRQQTFTAPLQWCARTERVTWPATNPRDTTWVPTSTECAKGVRSSCYTFFSVYFSLN